MEISERMSAFSFSEGVTYDWQTYNILATPKQWISKDELGEVASGCVEKVGESIPEVREKYVPQDDTGRKLSSDMVSLTAWMVKHKDTCLDPIPEDRT